MADFEDLILPPDTRANQPAAGIAGRIYYVTDEAKIERDNGSAWVQYSVDALANPMTTQGDVIYGGASGAPTRLAKGTAAQVLTMNTGATAPEWKTPTAGGGGAVVQIVQTQSGGVQTTTATIPFDNTIPQNTEGGELYTLSITPNSATNILYIDVNINVSPSNNNSTYLALFQDTTAGAIAAGAFYNSVATSIHPARIFYKMVAGTTSPTTFKVRGGLLVGGTLTINGSSSGRIFGGVLISSITITEATP